MRSFLHEGQSLTPSARTLWEVQAFAQKPPVETAMELYRHILDRARPCIKRSQEAREAIQNADALSLRQAEVRQRFLLCIGGLPEIPQTVNARVTARRTYEGFNLENVILETRPNYYATCAVYTPKNVRVPGPAVLLVIGHTDAGKADLEYQYAAQRLCAAGFTVLALDPYGEGERFEHYELESDFQPIQGCSGEHDLMDWKLKLCGVSLARYFLSDALAALRYLKSRPEVDENRVALTGHSGGGTQTSLLMLAAAEEFACAAPCAYITDMRAMLEAGVDPDNEMIWPGSLAMGIDYADILLSMVPRPVLVLANKNDFFPYEGTLRAVSEARALWQRLSLSDPPEMVSAQSEHAFAQTLVEAAANLFSRVLTGRAQQGDFRFSPLPSPALEAAGGCILKARPNMQTLQREAERQLKDALKACRGDPRPLEARLNDLILPDPGSAVDEEIYRGGADRFTVYREGLCAPYAYLCVSWLQQEGLYLNGALLRPMLAQDAPLPTCVVLWPGGTARIAEHSWLIHREIASGRQVFICDLPGEGALTPAKLGGSDLYISWSTLYKLNAYLIQLGDSLAALRIRCVLSALKAAQGFALVQPDALSLYAEGDMQGYAAIAGVLTKTPALLPAPVQDLSEIVTQTWHDQTHTHAWALPGALRAFDPAELRCALKALKTPV